jgi:hypothetical protein
MSHIVFDIPYFILRTASPAAYLSLHKRGLHPFCPVYASFDPLPRVVPLCSGYLFIPQIALVARDLQGLGGVLGFATKSSSKSYKDQVLENRLILDAKTVQALSVASLAAEVAVIAATVAPPAAPVDATPRYDVGTEVVIANAFFAGKKALVVKVGPAKSKVVVEGMTIELPNSMLRDV